MWKIVIAATAIALASTAAQAQPQCNERDSVIKVLGSKYQEEPVAIGVSSSGKLFEVLAAKDGTTWTIISTTPQRWTCVVAAGESWHSVQEVIDGPEA